jgi:hypothetical protein
MNENLFSTPNGKIIQDIGNGTYQDVTHLFKTPSQPEEHTFQ